MPKFFVKENQINEEKINIINQDVNHIKNVLRKQVGDELEICNQDTQENYLAKIMKISEDEIKCDIIEKLLSQVESNVYLHIFQGLPKADKMELVIQKSVELGVNEITPVAMKRSVVKISSKDENKKIQRWQKISEVAAKQSGRNIIPNITNIANVKEIINISNGYDALIVAYENEQTNTLKNELQKLKEISKEQIKIGIVIGPEGGLEPADVDYLKEHGAKIVTLGKRILRTETVALNVASIIMYELEK
jgi:16S rRNA (uracil1498-N3)-methyltransferase